MVPPIRQHRPAEIPRAKKQFVRGIAHLEKILRGIDLGNVRLENGQIVLQEKDFTLEHSLMLADRLRGHGFNVVMTRTADTEVNPDNIDVNNDGTVAAEGGAPGASKHGSTLMR